MFLRRSTVWILLVSGLVAALPFDAAGATALAVALIGSEAVLKLFPEPDPHPRV